MTSPEQSSVRRVGVIAGGGSLPAAVIKSIARRGNVPVLFAIRAHCNPAVTVGLPHHWIELGQLGRLIGLMQREGCQEAVFIGSVIRPALREVRLDFKTLRALPALVASFRGGDDHLLTGVARILSDHGLRIVGIGEVAADLTVPSGTLTQRAPNAAAEADIATARAVLGAISPFDVGQAAVVIDGHVVAVEDIEGTDALLARVARLRADGKIRAALGRGVIVKMPKTGQDLRFDMPTIGPQTVEGVRQAQLAGMAVAAGQTLLAEPEAFVAAADHAGLFAVGVTV